MADIRPRVSIGMPVYNEEHFIRQALDSLLAQTFQDFELIICDNASTDQTGDICLEYAAKDRRIRYYRSDHNAGSIANFNRAFQLCDTEYFFWASGHDLRHETFISRCIEVLDRDASIVLCYPLAQWIESDDRYGEVILDSVDTRGLDQLSAFHTMLWGLRSGYPIYGVMRSGALRRTRLARYTVAADIILLAELSLLGSVAHVPEPLLYPRRLSDWGDWKQYLAKSLGAAGSARQCHSSPFLRWVCAFGRAVRVHVRGRRARLICTLSVLVCALAKYGWIRRGLRNR